MLSGNWASLLFSPIREVTAEGWLGTHSWLVSLNSEKPVPDCSFVTRAFETEETELVVVSVMTRAFPFSSIFSLL